MLRLSVVLLLCLAVCTPPTPPTASAQPALTYLGQLQLAHAATFAGTTIGGLSGISYDPGRDCYYVISDDRSAHGPARFYTMRVNLSGNGIDDVTVTGMSPLDPGSSPSPAPPDPEGIAFDAGRQRLYWSSEGERITDGPTPVLADPWVRIAGLDGRYLGQFTMPADLTMSVQPTGPRRNTTLEGLTLAPGGRVLFAAMEGPGYDDGPLPNRGHGALTRITAFDVDTRLPVAQYAYPLEAAPLPAETNGLTDLVALGDTEFLVVERAFSARPSVRLFRAEIGAATDVLDSKLTRATPMTKTLLVDLATVADPIDNIEGLTLGPRLPDGRQSVLLVSDDNFAPTQVTQFLLLTLNRYS